MTQLKPNLSRTTWGLAAALLCFAQGAGAQSRAQMPGQTAQTPARGTHEAATAQPAAAPAATPSIVDWLARMHAATRRHSYVGTFVVSVAGGNLSSARIWHACEGDAQIERVEALSGPPRSTFRRNEEVMTFFPESGVVKSERRENLGIFPNVIKEPDSTIGQHYGLRRVGQGRIAGFDTDVMQVVPQDKLRFAYRIWTERRTGLLMKLQTLDGDGRVVEQSAFSELQLDAPIKVKTLAQMMHSTAGFRVEKAELERTTAAEEGWVLATPVTGFRPAGCYRRLMAGDSRAPERVVQCTFTDGLASVSLFLESYNAERQPTEALFSLGATHTLTRRLSVGGDWWLTAVGEVPSATLEAFAQGLARIR